MNKGVDIEAIHSWRSVHRLLLLGCAIQCNAIRYKPGPWWREDSC